MYLPIPSPRYCSFVGVEMAQPLLRLNRLVREGEGEVVGIGIGNRDSSAARFSPNRPEEDDGALKSGRKVERRMGVALAGRAVAKVADDAVARALELEGGTGSWMFVGGVSVVLLELNPAARPCVAPDQPTLRKLRAQRRGDCVEVQALAAIVYRHLRGGRGAEEGVTGIGRSGSGKERASKRPDHTWRPLPWPYTLA